MFKKIFILVLFIFMVSFSIFANDSDINLKNEFGPELKHAPFFIKYAFRKAYKKEWVKAYYFERKDFLISYKNKQTEEKNHELQLAKEETQHEKELLQLRNLKEKKEYKRQKDRLDKKKLEERAERARQKAFDEGVANEKNILSEMQNHTNR